ncbi:MAG: hypothetical protein B6D59_01165 [Campylobacteraceae bacterium 4484_4]|nr:MAG: hypothetical protein B6D59_01165 [Campylobacteraceae bacterium 4484_4]
MMRIVLIVVLLFGAIGLQASCQSQLFSFKVKSTKRIKGTVLDVLENLTSECRMSMVFTDDMARKMVDKKISYLNVNNFTLTALLDLLLGDNNLFYELTDNNVLKISYLKTKSFYIDYVSFSKRSSSTNKTIKTGSTENGGGTTSVDSTSDFEFWGKIQKEIESILNRDGDQYNASKTLINQEAGIVTVTGTKKQLDRVEAYIKKVTERLHKQILIDAKIIEVTFDKAHTDGIDWTKFRLDLNGNAQGQKTDIVNTFNDPSYLIGYDFTIAGLLNFLRTQGDVSVVSNPKVLTLNNQPAIINVGEEKNYKYSLGSTVSTTPGGAIETPQYEVGSTFVGVTLSIVPEVTKNDFIMLKVNPTISEISERHLDEKGNPDLAPDIKVKQLSSIVKVKNGRKVLIGGLIQKREEDKINKIPLLGDIPLLGYAFKSKNKVHTKSEMIIVITPRLVSGDGEDSLASLERMQDAK